MNLWRSGAPTKPWCNEWFIAETTFGVRVVLIALPEEHTYDFKTADDTFVLAKTIKRWMQFPDADYCAPDRIEGERDLNGIVASLDVMTLAREAAARAFERSSQNLGRSPAYRSMDRHYADKCRSGEGDSFDAVRAALEALAMTFRDIEVTDEMIEIAQRAYDNKLRDMAGPYPTEEPDAGGGPLGYALRSVFWSNRGAPICGDNLADSEIDEADAWLHAVQDRKRRLAAAEERIEQEWRWGNLTKLGVTNHLVRAGHKQWQAIEKAERICGPAEYPPVKITALIAALQTARNYIVHVGANQTERGLPHPQQLLLDKIRQALGTDDDWNESDYPKAP